MEFGRLVCIRSFAVLTQTEGDAFGGALETVPDAGLEGSFGLFFIDVIDESYFLATAVTSSPRFEIAIEGLEDRGELFFLQGLGEVAHV